MKYPGWVQRASLLLAHSVRHIEKVTQATTA